MSLDVDLHLAAVLLLGLWRLSLVDALDLDLMSPVERLTVGSILEGHFSAALDTFQNHRRVLRGNIARPLLRANT